MNFITNYLDPLLKTDKENMSENFKKIARYSKRFISQTLGGGIIESLLFAYNKAKVENVLEFINGNKSIVMSNQKLKDNGPWIIILGFLYLNILKDHCKLNTPDLINILNSTCFESKNRSIIERVIVRYMILFTRIIEAYGD